MYETRVNHSGAQWKTVLCVFLLAGAVACAHGLSRDAKSLVDYDGTALDVQQSPKEFMGRVVLWGGRIIETRVLKERTDVYVLQQPLDLDDRPLSSDDYLGRFIVRSPELLDPAVFNKDLMVSVVGTLMDGEVSNIGEREYIYPVIEPKEVKVWEPKQDATPMFHFGFGFGTQF
ncbi:MAG: Slp family lipoprotein [Deltaproteobacteria bacterium]|nr:Slp family lipoprotein [Deltaproteobacteria bacterium]